MELLRGPRHLDNGWFLSRFEPLVPRFNRWTMESFDRNGLSLWQLIIRDKRYRWWLFSAFFFFLKIFNTFFRSRIIRALKGNESESFKDFFLLPFWLLTNGLNFKDNKNEFLYCFDLSRNLFAEHVSEIKRESEIFKILKFYFSLWEKLQFFRIFFT